MTCRNMEKERLYAAALLSIPALGSRSIRALVAVFGSAEIVWNQPAEALQAAVGLSDTACRNIGKWRLIYDWEQQERLRAAYGVSIVSIWEEAYPPALRETYNPPVILYYQGSLPNTLRSAAIVGARNATPYGRNAAHTFAEALGRHQITVISGGARGIDTKAHCGAIAGGGQTVAVVANGLDRVYPAENKRLFAQIIEQGGCVCSEYAFGTPPKAMQFPARNRIIAGMSRCVVVVEAALRSGSLITADFALEEGRDVFAVPGSIYSDLSKGTNALLRKGAIALTGIDDILLEYGWENDANNTQAEPSVQLTQAESAVLDVLSCETALSRDMITVQTQLPPQQVSIILLRLVLLGRIEEINGFQYIKRPLL